MAEAIEGLGFSQEIRDALVQKSGPLGLTLWAVIAYEQAEWRRHALMRFQPRKLRHSYLDSLNWSHTVMRGLMI